MGDEIELRVSDDDRLAYIELLRDETSSGRLTLAEFEDRVGEAYAALTAGDLLHTLRGLPVEAPPTSVDTPSAPHARRDDNTDEMLRRRYRLGLRRDLAGFAVPNFIVNFVWLMGDTGYWWPGWVLMGTGVGLLGKLIKGYDPEEERRELLAERGEEAMDEIQARHREH